MIVYLSGGSAIPETHLRDPTVMLSFYVEVSHATDRPSRRMRDLMRARALYPKTLPPPKGDKCPKQVHVRKTPRKKKSTP